MIMQNSLYWLMNGTRNLLSIRSTEPEIQNDNSIPLAVTLTVEGINFLVGHDVLLNDVPVEITAINMNGSLEILVPAGLPPGLLRLSFSRSFLKPQFEYSQNCRRDRSPNLVGYLWCRFTWI